MLGIDLALRARRPGGPPPLPASAITALVVQGPGALPDGAGAADPNGWVARASLPAAAGTTFDPTRIVLTVRDPGFDNGVPVLRTRTIRGGAVIRRQLPNQADRLATVSGGTLDVFFSLTDDIYAGTTIAAAVAEAGYHGAAPAGTVAGVLNLSTRAYPKPLACALNKPEERATGASFAWEILAVHRHAMNGRQVDCVKAAARDENGTVGETVTVTETALSDVQPTGLRPEVFKGTTLLAPLGQGQLCRLEWEIYPHIGDASAVLRVASDGFAWPTPRPHTPLRFLNDRTGGYGGAHAAVRIGATGGQVAASRTAAEATPFPTILAALQAVQAWNATNKGHNDHSGATLWLMARATSPAALACWTSGGWRFLPPVEGMHVWITAARLWAVRDGGAWRLGEARCNTLIVGGQQVVGPRQSAVPAPTGGASIDAEARAAIVALIARLQAHGMIEAE